MLNQSRAVDKSRLNEKLGDVARGTMRLVDEALKTVFALS